MYCIIYIIPLCFSEELDVPGVSTWKRKAYRAISKFYIALGMFSACTARFLITEFANTRLGADSVATV